MVVTPTRSFSLQCLMDGSLSILPGGGRGGGSLLLGEGVKCAASCLL